MSTIIFYHILLKKYDFQKNIDKQNIIKIHSVRVEIIFINKRNRNLLLTLFI